MVATVTAGGESPMEKPKRSFRFVFMLLFQVQPGAFAEGATSWCFSSKASSKSSSSSWTLYGLVAVAVAIAVQAFLLYGSPSTTATEPEPSASKGPTPLDDVTQHYLEEEKHRKQVEGGELLCWPCCKKPEPCSTCSDTWPCWESELDQKEGGRRGGFVYEMPSEQWHHRTASAYQGPHTA